MGEVIGGRRVCGKTTELIKRANKEQLYILCPNRQMAKITFDQAKEMGLDIHYPVTPEEVPMMSRTDRVLVDEVESVLSYMLGVKVVGMSSSMEFDELPSLRNESKTTDKNKSYFNGFNALTCYFEQMEGKQDEPLLTIELQDMGSVPTVKYKGEEIKYKTHVMFDWGTKTDDVLFGGPEFEIEHVVPGKGNPGHTNTIKKVQTFKYKED